MARQRGPRREGWTSTRHGARATGAGTATCSITRSENPAEGASRGSRPSHATTRRSAWARAKQSGESSRWTSRAEGRGPSSQRARSSGVKCPVVGSIISASYGGSLGGVSLFQVSQIHAQLVAGTVDIGLHRTQREVERRGDLFIRQPFDMAQHDARPVFGAELPDRLFDRLPDL